MSRTPPERTPDQQREHDYMHAMRDGTPDAVRAWAARYDVPLIQADDDELLLVSIHTARADLLTGRSKRESQLWLATHKDRIMSARRGAE